MQPFLTLNYCFALNGIYPSRNSQNPFIAELMIFAGNFAPKDWTFCDGQLLSINSYPAAYSLVGTIYGGNGITTFGIPDLRGRTPIHEGQGSGLTNRTLGSRSGNESTVLSISNLPAHNHSIIVQ
ncbi:tail fiber protein [bacterium SCSIO 12741]|nr:tail fiber protein [bacterium SCSIO 12741]